MGVSSIATGFVASALAITTTLVACGDDRPPETPIHPQLECVGDERDFHPPADIDISGPGAPTADAALRESLGRSIDRLGGGEIVVLSDTEYGIEVDGRIVLIHGAVANDDRQWHVVDVFYCSTDETGQQLVLSERG